MLSLVRTVHTEEDAKQSKVCQVCVSKLSSGDLFGVNNSNMTVYTTTAISETLTICYILDKVQMNTDLWDRNTKRKLEARSIKFQDDVSLLRRHSEQHKFKMRSALIIRKVQSLIEMNHIIKNVHS